MAKEINTRETCKECAFFKNDFCVKTNAPSRAIYYACHRFKTPKELAAEVECGKNEIEPRFFSVKYLLLALLYLCG